MEKRVTDKVILDLGCGFNKKPWAIGMDNFKDACIDVVHDLNDFPYPFEDESADKIILSHVLEHFFVEDINKILDECYRILKPNAIVEISLPHCWSSYACGDITHKTFFNFDTIRDHIGGEQNDYNRLKQPFKIIRTAGSVDAFNDSQKIIKTRKKSLFYGTKVDYIISKFFSKLLTKIIWHFPDFVEIFVKFLPAYGVSIHITLKK